jgi:hypothetical protein
LPPPRLASAQSLTQMLGSPLTRDLDSPCFVTSWPGNPRLLVVVERGSRQVTLWDLDALADGPTTIVKIDEAFLTSAPTVDFIGVTGVAFHPDFLDADGGEKRALYVRYNREATVESGIGTTVRTFVKSFEIATGKVQVTYSTETTVYTWPTMQTGHGSGTLQFDRRSGLNTERLFVPMPDHAEADTLATGMCCRAARAQGTSTSSDPDIGRLLSIDVHATGFPVTVEAQGFRNPFGFSVDRGATSNGQGRGDVWLGDTGHTVTGSIIRVLPGTVSVENYGWPWLEVDRTQGWTSQPMVRAADCSMNPTLYGNISNSCPETSPAPSYSLPFIGFADDVVFGTSSRDAIIGGVVYRGTNVSSLTDRYVFGIYGNGRLPRVYHSSSTATNLEPTDISSSLGISTSGSTGWTSTTGIHAIGDDWSGENLYIVRVDSSVTGSTGNGTVWRIDP